MVEIVANRRALLLGNIFNLLAAIYFIIIAVTALIQLRWYHKLTVTVRLRHLVTSATSYFAFILLIFVAIVLMSTFVISTMQLQHHSKVFSGDRAHHWQHRQRKPHNKQGARLGALESVDDNDRRSTDSRHWRQDQAIDRAASPSSAPAATPAAPTTLSSSLNEDVAQQQQQQMNKTHRAPQIKSHNLHRNGGGFFGAHAGTCCSSLIYLIAAVGLVLVLVIWLVNTGELVRESIMSQLELAFVKYQFSNRSNHYSIAVDAMQDTNNCCGSLDYTDFPHQRYSGLSIGHYPGSCCGKHIFGVNARVICTPEEIWRAEQTTGCTTVLANYYEIVSMLVVPVALIGLFVNVFILALVTIARVQTSAQHKDELFAFEHTFHAPQRYRTNANRRQSQQGQLDLATSFDSELLTMPTGQQTTIMTQQANKTNER